MLFELPKTYRVWILAACSLQTMRNPVGQYALLLVSIILVRLPLGEGETEQRTLGRGKIYPQLGTGSRPLF
jgi:hypothetical protein